MTEPAAKRVFESPADGHYFFGYFNTPQVSHDDSRLLALKCDFIDRVPDKDDRADVGYFGLGRKEQRFTKIGETTAFNWQQGCMLQFCGPDFTRTVAYNDFDGETFVTHLVDLETGDRRTLDRAIYAMFPDGKQALTIDFARHYWCRRGYSYGNIVDEEKNRPVVPGDGIWLIDIASGASQRIIAIEDMLKRKPISSMDGATHYLEHLTPSPLGTKFAFLHRWKYSGGIHSRLCIADRTGDNVRILNDSGRMSHYCWRDDNRLIGYGGIANSLNRLRKNKTLIKSVFRFLLPVYHKFVKDSSGLAKRLTGDSYLEIDTASGRVRPIASSLRAEDGHPTMMPSSDSFVTDTYARAKIGQNAQLLAYDLAQNGETAIAELGSIAEYDETPMRCDLHPRVSPSGNILSIDTMDRGRRSVYAYRLRTSVAAGGRCAPTRERTCRPMSFADSGSSQVTGSGPGNSCPRRRNGSSVA